MKTCNHLDLALDPAAFARSVFKFNPDTHQASVLATSIRRGLLNCCRQWGKSTVTAIKAVHRAYFYPNSLTLVCSPSARQSAEFLRKCSPFLRKLNIRPRGDGDNEISLLFPNGSRIVGLPGAEATIRGFSASLILIDEAARVGEDIYAAVRPMLATQDGELWLMSTPNGRQGFFYNTWTNTPLGERWTRISVPATECPRISRRFLQEERAALGDPFFRQEYLCEFLDDETSLFTLEALRAIVRDDIPPFVFSNLRFPREIRQ